MTQNKHWNDTNFPSVEYAQRMMERKLRDLAEKDAVSGATTRLQGLYWPPKYTAAHNLEISYFTCIYNIVNLN